MSFYKYVAPMQGHTDAAWRHFHAKVYGEADAYFTPFIRIERGDVRSRDIRDLTDDLNDNHFIIPQIIFDGEKEFDRLVEVISDAGIREIDLNLGCPYPMQTHRGRGAALIANPEMVKIIADKVNALEDFSFSVKVRAGLTDKAEWKGVVDILNDMNLSHITFHPRIASQKYSGELAMDEFTAFLERCEHPVIYNGDIKDYTDIIRLKNEFPELAGIMTGRGILSRPSLIAEFSDGFEWQRDKRLDTMLSFHDKLKAYYASRLCGDTQLLTKLKSFWEYAEAEIGRKPWKLIKKATTMAKYDSAVSSI